MIPELTLIKYSLLRENYNVCISYINVTNFPQELQGVFRCIAAFFENHEDVNELSVDDLSNLFFATRPKDREYYVTLFENLRTITIQESTVRELCLSLKQAELLRQLSMSAYSASEGDKKALEASLNALKTLSEINNNNSVGDENDFDFFSTDIEEVIANDKQEPGLLWRLDSLNRALGPIRKGNLGFIVARPESGKTQFVLDQGSYMMGQADGYVLHLNNEEAATAVLPRYYQASLGWTREQVFANPQKAKNEFYKRGGDKLLFVDKAHISAKLVEKICEKYKPKLIISDQMDKIEGFANDREDLRLGMIYRWHRELAKEYCPVMGLTQANGSGEGVKWLDMGHVANSATAKQAEADWILGIGKIHDSGYETLRFLHLSKNKLPGWEQSDPNMRHGKWEILSNPNIVRYIDL